MQQKQKKYAMHLCNQLLKFMHEKIFVHAFKYLYATIFISKIIIRILLFLLMFI